MSSRRRLRRKCARKVTYPTIGAAVAAMHQQEARLRFLRPYRCPYCRAYHLGRSTGKTFAYLESQRAR